MASGRSAHALKVSAGHVFQVVTVAYCSPCNYRIEEARASAAEDIAGAPITSLRQASSVCVGGIRPLDYPQIER